MTNTRVNEIDLLRFLAALSVVLFHYSFRGYAADGMSVMPYPLLGSVAKYGYLGVELFFMISGFVILMTAANGSLQGFIVSRLVRLYPAFWACCTATFFVTIIIGEPRYSATIYQYLVNMTMLNGFFGIPSIDGAYWSLFVELRFYVLVTFVLSIKKIQHAQNIIIAWLISTIVLEFFPSYKLRYILIADYSVFFIAGATYFLIWSKGASLLRIAMITISWLLAVFKSTIGIDAFEIHYKTTMSNFAVAGIITAFFVLMLLIALKRTGFFGRRPWLLSGALTYPLYLLHQNIGFMVFNEAYPTVNEHILFWGMILVSIVSAYCVHVLIENKFSSILKDYLINLSKLLENWAIRFRRSSEVHR